MKNGLMSSDLVRFPVPVVNWEINPTPFWLIRVWIACLSPDRILWVRFLCVIVFIVFLVWVKEAATPALWFDRITAKRCQDGRKMIGVSS